MGAAANKCLVPGALRAIRSYRRPNKTGGFHMRRGLGLLSAVVLLFAGSAVGASAASASSALPRVATSVTGTWHLHTNDCFFGVCDYTLHLVQNGHSITGGAGSGISGRIRAPRIVI